MKKTLGHIHFSLKLLIFIWLVGAVLMFFKQQFEASNLCQEYQGTLTGWYWCSEHHYRLEVNTPTPQHLNPLLWPVEVFQSIHLNSAQKTAEKPQK